jgi:AcrR family transcriptional regulator
MEPQSTRIPSGRSQVLRSQATRTRVIEAAVACIAEEGFHAANLARIAERAGVTTGAIQHQFGEKAALLAAAVERGFERMTDAVARVPARTLALDERVTAFVRGLWDGYDADHTRAGFEILLALRSDADFRDRTLGFLAGLRERLDRLWMGTFWDADVPRPRHVEAQRLIFTTLNGLALERILLPEMPDPQADLERLARGALEIMKEE